MTKLRARNEATDYTDMLLPAKPLKKRRGSDDEEDSDEFEKKPKAKVTKRRKKEVTDDDDDKPVVVAKSKPVSKPKKTTSETTQRKVAAVEVEMPVAGDFESLRKKYDALREFRETETERLLKEARALAQEEKKTYEKLISKLKKEITTLSARTHDAETKQAQRLEKLQTEHELRIEALKRERKEAEADSARLRKQIRELEGGSSRNHLMDLASSARRGEDSVELSHAKKLLNVYRLVTSTEIRLIEGSDDEDEDDTYTDVACATIDSVTGKRFQFDLAIPTNDTDEVEYVPNDKQSGDFKPPTYLQEELSFKRSEMTKFMRTLLDVVIRKKSPSSGKR
ncbi:hypothetical protein Poli38472_000467 [Pythium oligandrum]|uniref:Monopolin complex subunit Csm1/Pcs1 C-terminal domain-containing protein n=1 Tax=Pythium oligandrum TaxID=41045 RepID=A0A8K1CCS1_PYTOL|nr:hypothetical protein Poli38472_000467 [Pythium oligandrum]|eukprot:TMW60425.1 hypothetical protein Poli38472_000467 [Pythium oligandrum]